MAALQELNNENGKHQSIELHLDAFFGDSVICVIVPGYFPEGWSYVLSDTNKITTAPIYRGFAM